MTAEDVVTGMVAQLVDMRDAMGWRRTTRENAPTRLMSVMAEAHELERALRTEPDHRVAEELADVAMYALVAAYDLRHGELRELHNMAWRHEVAPRAVVAPGELLEPLRAAVVAGYEAWRLGGHHQVAGCLEDVFGVCWELALMLRVDLFAAMRTKMAYNRTRPLRNGGKHPDS